MKNKSKLTLIFALIFFLMFACLLMLVKCGYVFKMDNLNTFIASNRADNATIFFKVLTYLGEWKILVPLSILPLVFFKDKTKALYVFLSVVFAIGINFIFKFSIQRLRPTNCAVVEEGFSFPSMHIMCATAFWGALAVLVAKTNWKCYIKATTYFLIGLIIVLVGLSRVYLGVHYLSDIVAGFCLSLSILLFILFFLQKLSHKMIS